MMRRGFILSALIAACVVLTGCSGDGQVSSGSSSAAVQGVEESGLPDDAVKIDDIDWDIDQGVDNGTRRVMFSFTNNSEYAIAGIRLDLVFKEDASSEDIASAFDYIIEDGSTEEDIRDWTMHAESTFLVEPGDSSIPDACGVGAYYVNNVEQYELMDPDMMTFVIYHDGKLYEEYYDYRSETYSMSSEVIDANQWSESELASKLPRPEGEIVVSLRDSTNQFSFDTACTTSEGYSAYVQACKDAGFTSNVVSGDTFYYADNNDGACHVDMMYSSDGDLAVFVSPINSEA